MEADQFWFVPPCPQLGDTNLCSALGALLAELRPVLPLPDQESFLAQTDLCFGTGSHGSLLCAGPGRLNPHGGKWKVPTATHGPGFSCF